MGDVPPADYVHALAVSADDAHTPAVPVDDAHAPAVPVDDAHALAVPVDDAHALAVRVADAMFARDRASQALGMRILAVAPGSARLSMRVRADMLNGHAICHGGFIFTLADSTFAFACNSRDLATVASACTIDFLAPAREGDVLTAAAIERSIGGRMGVYDIEVTNLCGDTIALFRGKSYRVGGHVIDPGARDA
ncbi:MAG: hydroxyphenylacetyl-CoA thioesterase PaaI [Casimicrobiaceae bacterium]